MAKLYITVPIKALTKPSTLALDTRCMGLRPKDVSPNLIYGFYGKNLSKAQPLNAAFSRANKGDCILRGDAFFYLVDIMFETSANFNDAMLDGQLQEDMLPRAPFIVAKRITSGAAAKLGAQWHNWAKQLYGADRVNRQRSTNWEDALSFMQAYPLAVESMFEEYPQLRCAVIPMEVNMGGTGDERNMTMAWVGVTRADKAVRWIAESSVRMNPDITVNLK